jgi:hypothetical protein
MKPSCFYFLVLFVICFITPANTASVMPSYCDSMVYSKNGEVDVEPTILNCSTHSTSPTIMPNYQGSKSLNVSAQLVVNNLVYIDQLKQVVQMDFKFRLTWFDNRLNITDALFKSINPFYASNGIDLTFLKAEGSLRLWLPDM